MRWPFRRDDARPEPHDAAPREPADSTGGWQALGPLPTSWSGTAPLTTSAQAPFQPLLGGAPRGARPSQSVTGAEPAPGRVSGLAVTVRAPARPTAAAAPGYLSSAPPLRHAPARALVQHASLIEATPAYVGEPVAPAADPIPARPAPGPPVAPSRTDPPVEAMTEAGARFREALANLHKRGAPDYVPGQDVAPPDTSIPAATSAPSAAAAWAPPATRPSSSTAADSAQGARPGTAPGVRPGTAPGARPGTAQGARADALPGAPLVHRRNSLAQSRRLGLGAPLDPADVPANPTDLLTDPVAASPSPSPSSPLSPSLPPERSDQQSSDEYRPDGCPGTFGGSGSDSGSGSGDDRPSTRESGPAREPLRTTPLVRPLSGGPRRNLPVTGPLTFRSAPRPAPAPAAASGPRQGTITRAPADLADALHRSHHIDVADVPVRRDQHVAAEAGRRGARAFTRGAEVHLPASVGDPASGAARGLLAHELVHAAQQRRFGSALPAEDTPQGHALELEALAAEQAHGGSPAAGASSAPVLRHAPQPASTAWVEERLTQHAKVDLVTDPGEPRQFVEIGRKRDEVRFEVQRLLNELLSSSQYKEIFAGAGGGSASDEDSKYAETKVGKFEARNVEELEKITLAQYNLARVRAGLPEVSSLDQGQRAAVAEQFTLAEDRRKQALQREQEIKADREAKQEQEKAAAAQQAKVGQHLDAAALARRQHEQLAAGLIPGETSWAAPVEEDATGEPAAGTPPVGRARSAAFSAGAGVSALSRPGGPATPAGAGVSAAASAAAAAASAVAAAASARAAGAAAGPPAPLSATAASAATAATTGTAAPGAPSATPSATVTPSPAATAATAATAASATVAAAAAAVLLDKTPTGAAAAAATPAASWTAATAGPATPTGPKAVDESTLNTLGMKNFEDYLLALKAKYNLARVQAGLSPVDTLDASLQKMARDQWDTQKAQAEAANLRVFQQQQAAAEQTRLASRAAVADRGITIGGARIPQVATAAADPATGTGSLVAAGEAITAATAAYAVDTPPSSWVAAQSRQAPIAPAAQAPPEPILSKEDLLTPDHLDALTDRMYDRLRRKLRTEFLVDRERAGLLADFR